MSSVSYRDALRHRASGLSLQKTADACGCARSTVQDIVQLAKKRDVGWKDVEDLADAEAYELVRGKPVVITPVSVHRSRPSVRHSAASAQ